MRSKRLSGVFCGRKACEYFRETCRCSAARFRSLAPHADPSPSRVCTICWEHTQKTRNYNLTSPPPIFDSDTVLDVNGRLWAKLVASKAWNNYQNPTGPSSSDSGAQEAQAGATSSVDETSQLVPPSIAIPAPPVALTVRFRNDT